jgi:uncharacterized protein YdhG (YjbR/CyaY superfamily)
MLHNHALFIHSSVVGKSRCSSDRDVAGAFARFDEHQQRALNRTWEAALKVLDGAEQCIAWGMPTLRIDGDLVLSLDGFTSHNSVFPGPGVIERIEVQRTELTVTKGTIHFDRDKPMSAAVLKAIITARIDEINASYPKSNGQFKEFYANGFLKSVGKIKAGDMHGAWAWYRRDGTLKRSGGFKAGVQVGEWVTYDAKGKPYRTTDFGRG